jgi:CheY-like chemotaxis protein/HPt (histidine-containing phosphotransfer) domain-containing protein
MLQAPHHPYALILMDWQMPGMDGIDTSRRIRSGITPLSSAPIVMISAHGREELMTQAADIGIASFLIKPVTPSLLLDTMMQILGKQQSRMAHADEELLPGEGLPHFKARLAGLHVLLVEDNEINQAVAQGVLHQAGITVEVANNGAECVARLQADNGERSFDAVLMDCQMPILDGYAATRILRADPRFADLPIIAMTANAMSGDREKCLEAGMNDHVSKPIAFDRLYSALAQWTPQPDTVNEAAQRSPGLGSTADAGNGGGAAALAGPVTPATPADEAAALSSALPGLDVMVALGRLGGDTVLYRKLLGRFVETQVGAVDAMRRAFQAGLLDKTREQAHGLKGIAGNIGARRLAETIGQLELALHDTAGVAAGGAAEAALARASDLHEKLLARIRALVVATPPGIPADADADRRAGSPRASWDWVAVKSILQNLEEHLRYDDTCALDEIEALRPLLAGTPAATELMVIYEAIGRYDFVMALSHLPVLSQVIDEMHRQ